LALEWDSYCRALSGSGIYLQDRDDELYWTSDDKSGILTVKNVYRAIATITWQQPIGGWRKYFWTWNIALKIIFFLWLALENKILTWDTLLTKGWEGPSFCILCTNGPEYVSHLLINCCFTKQVWLLILGGLNLRFVLGGLESKALL
jgi:hypothetical protein